MVCLLGLIVAMLWLSRTQYRHDLPSDRTTLTGAVTGSPRTPVLHVIDSQSYRSHFFDPDTPAA